MREAPLQTTIRLSACVHTPTPHANLWSTGSPCHRGRRGEGPGKTTGEALSISRGDGRRISDGIELELSGHQLHPWLESTTVVRYGLLCCPVPSVTTKVTV